MRNRGALAAMVAGVAALAVVSLAACGSQSREDVGGAEVARLASPTPTGADTRGAGQQIPITSGDLPTAAATVPPTRLRIPAIDVTATVDAVGINEQTKEFDVPPSVDEIGWYRYGPGLEAERGSIVIAGHVDSAEQGKGAFYRLRELDQGDTVSVTGSDGRQREYRVVAREEYDKSKIPLDRYFARDGEVRLTLITCGGPFDAEARRYRDNIVVTAVPA